MVTKRNLQCYCIKCECLKTNLHLSCWTGHAFMALLFSLSNTPEDCCRDFMPAILNEPPGKQKGVSFGVIWIRRNQWIHHGKGFIISSDASWSKRSWIVDPDLNLQPHTKLNVLISQGKFICWGMAWIGIRKEWSLTGEIEGWEKMVLFTVN